MHRPEHDAQSVQVLDESVLTSGVNSLNVYLLVIDGPSVEADDLCEDHVKSISVSKVESKALLTENGHQRYNTCGNDVSEQHLSVK